ncbi:MAG: hypothetical protein ABS36_01340 [Acidobacteria bacterium SCN 69-37]|nr:MAG: hypothetical protein ABS36_01340 [Acidobacteria bacterium SCN 69-37]
MGHPHRLEPTQYIGAQAVFLTCCTVSRRRTFVAADVVRTVETQMRRVCLGHGFHLPAYCFMPDHVHALVTSEATTVELGTLVRSLKQVTGYAHRRRTGERLWQTSFFDRTLRGDEDRIAVVRYIVANPVRAGLVDSPDDYPYWGSTLYSRSDILEFFERERHTVWTPGWKT